MKCIFIIICVVKMITLVKRMMITRMLAMCVVLGLFEGTYTGLPYLVPR